MKKKRIEKVFLLSILIIVIVACLPSLNSFEKCAEASTESVGLTTNPLNVLFKFAPETGGKCFLARYLVRGLPGAGVIIYDLEPNSQSERGYNEAPFEKSNFLCQNLTDWVEKNLSLKVHLTVEIERGTIPPSRKGLKGSPLLELAATYPGEMPESFYGIPGVEPQETPGFSAKTTPHTSKRKILELLRGIEEARLETELFVLPYKGGEKASKIEERLGVLEGKAKILANVIKFGNQRWDMNEKFSLQRDFLFVYRPLHLRGSLPPVNPPVIIRRGTSSPKVALTIDDGWNADRRILELLKRWNIRYTAFIVGNVARFDPGLVRELYINGAEVCNHTLTHRKMRNITEPVILQEIWGCEDELCGVTHELYPYIRFFGGTYDQFCLDITAREGFRVVDWTIDSDDTRRGLTTEERKQQILANLQPGAILLFHFAGFDTFELLKEVIPEIRSRGYEITTLTEFLR